jgi:hypothetical protein
MSNSINSRAILITRDNGNFWSRDSLLKLELLERNRRGVLGDGVRDGGF